MAKLTNESLMRLRSLQEKSYTIRYITLDLPDQRSTTANTPRSAAMYGSHDIHTYSSRNSAQKNAGNTSTHFSTRDMQKAAYRNNAKAAAMDATPDTTSGSVFRTGVPKKMMRAQIIANSCAEHKIKREADLRQISKRQEEIKHYDRYSASQILAEKESDSYLHPERNRATVSEIKAYTHLEAGQTYRTEPARERQVFTEKTKRNVTNRSIADRSVTECDVTKRSANAESQRTQRIIKERSSTGFSQGKASTASKAHTTSAMKAAYRVSRDAKELQAAVNNAENSGSNAGASVIEATGKQASRSAARRMGKAARKAAGKAAKKATISVASGVKRIVLKMAKSLVAAVGSSKALMIGGIVFCVLAVGMIVATVLCSPFGILYTSENKDNPTLESLIVENELRYKAKLDKLVRQNNPDIVEMTCNGGRCGNRSNNWPDILGIWSVRSSMQLDMDVMELKPPKIKLLEKIFDDMVKVDHWIEYRRQTEVVGTTADGQSITREKIIKVLHIEITEYKYKEMYDPYDFDRDEKKTTEELFADPTFTQLANELAASACCCCCCPGSSCAISTGSELPVSVVSNSEVVNLASQYLGVSYNTMDCSQLSGAVYRAMGVNLPRTAAEQARYCNSNGWNVSAGNLQAGDLIFYSLKGDNGRYMNVSHVAVYAGNGKMIDASSIYGEIVYRDVFNTTPTMYARPQSGL